MISHSDRAAKQKVVVSIQALTRSYSCPPLDPVLGEAGILRPAVLRPGQEVQRATAALGPLPETIRFPAPSSHTSATYRRLHPQPPAKGRRAVLGQPAPQQLQPEHLHVQLPETLAPQGVHAQSGLGYLAALRHPGAPAKAPSAAEVNNTYMLFLRLFPPVVSLFFHFI